MGGKLLWTGLTIILAFQFIATHTFPINAYVGAIIMVIGLILMWLDK